MVLKLNDNRNKALKEKEAMFKKHSKGLDGDGKPAEKPVLSVVRSSVRKAWMRSPTKLSLLAKERHYVDDVPPNKRPQGIRANTKWLYKCSQCAKYFLQKDVEVDHKKAQGTLLSYDDMEKYTRSILDVGWNDLQLLCKPCHSVKTYVDRYGGTFEEALVAKKVIELAGIPVKVQKDSLLEHGFTAEQVANDEKRKLCWKELILKGEIEV